ncbi:MAG: hypothetical protein LBT45_02305 [Rickettsiales bacterium]|jgi:hypothetical protein|nr:hypothetical protein [Rickettsiales bacterium]
MERAKGGDSKKKNEMTDGIRERVQETCAGGSDEAWKVAADAEEVFDLLDRNRVENVLLNRTKASNGRRNNVVIWILEEERRISKRFEKRFEKAFVR